MDNKTKARDYDFQNGFNCCIEKSIRIVNEIMRGSYTVNVSSAELLLQVKEKMLSMHYTGSGKESQTDL